MRGFNYCEKQDQGIWELKTVHMNISIQTEWLTAGEAAAYLKVKPRSLLLWVRQGKVKGHALSGTKRRVWRFRTEDLDASLIGTDVVASAPPAVLTERSST
jgi:excisionase family DNA binding protein